MGGFRFGLPCGARSFDGTGKLLGDAAAVAGAAMQVEDEVAQADIGEPLGDGVNGGALFGDEEDGSAVRSLRGDEVGDGLALTRAGRADQHHVVAGETGTDGGGLGGVGIEHEELFARRGIAGSGASIARFGRIFGADAGLCIRVVGEGGDERMGGYRCRGAFKVAHHRQLGEGEIAEHDAVGDCKSGQFRAGFGETPVDVADIAGADAVRERGFIDLDAEFSAEDVEQAVVDFPLLLEHEVEVGVEPAARFELGCAEEDRRVVDRPGVRPFPGGEAVAEVERGNSAFLAVLDGLAADGAGAMARLLVILFVGEEGGEHRCAVIDQVDHCARISRRAAAQIERAGAEVAVVEQAIAGGGVDQFVGPSLDGAADLGADFDCRLPRLGDGVHRRGEREWRLNR